MSLVKITLLSYLRQTGAGGERERERERKRERERNLGSAGAFALRW